MPEIRSFFDGTIILSGAMSTGAHIAAARALGADLAYLGTRFIATAEAADVRASHMVLARFVEEYLDSRRGDRSAGPTSEPIAHAV